jgi:hypothetical protein
MAPEFHRGEMQLGSYALLTGRGRIFKLTEDSSGRKSNVEKKM